jgi:hypothetical protein
VIAVDETENIWNLKVFLKKKRLLQLLWVT